MTLNPHEPYDIAPLIARVHSYAQKKGVTPLTASRLVFGEGSRLTRLEDGKTCTVETAEKAWAKLNELEAQLDAQAESA